jgi:hypothetical protein
MTSLSQRDEPLASLPLPDELILWRRVPKDSVVVEMGPDGLERSRPSSACFTDSRDGTAMSLFDSERCGGLPAVLEGHPGFGIASITVGQLRARGLTVARTTDGGPGHCEAAGKKTQSIKSGLAKCAKWVVRPGDATGDPPTA